MEEDSLTTPTGNRRNTRAALAEIPMRLGQLRVTQQPFAPVNLNNTFTPGFDNSPVAVPSSFLSPAPSPDELVIQQRGRRHIPVSWSPDIEGKKNSFQSNIRTPPKIASVLSPVKNGVTLRSTPRKRLLMNDVEKPALTPEKIDFTDISTPQKLKSPSKTGSSCKRMKIERKVELPSKTPIDVALKGLSHAQLIDLLKNVVEKCPTIEQDLRNNMPVPDLKPLDEKLNYLKLNIFKSLPTSRLTSKTDSPAFARVSTHLLAFKKCVIDQGRTLIESQHWNSVLDYVFLAWSYVRSTPLWDNHPHNAPRRQCFKALTTYCMMALKKCNLDRSMLIDFQDKLQGMIADSEDVHSCLKYVQGQINFGF